MDKHDELHAYILEVVQAILALYTAITGKKGESWVAFAKHTVSFSMYNFCVNLAT